MNHFFKLGVYEIIDDNHIAPSLNTNKFSYDEIKNITSKNDYIYKYVDLFHTWSIFNNNYSKYKREILQEKSTAFVDPYKYLTSITRLSKNLLLAEHVANVLSASFPFLETSKRALESKYSKNSQEIKDWNELRKDLHSENPEYQLCYELRNYLQHYSLPIAGTEIEIKKGKSEFSKPYADKNQLINCGYDWKSKITILEKFNSKIDLDSALDTFHFCLKKLFHKTISFIYADIRLFESHITSIYSKYGFSIDDDIIIFKFETEGQNFNDTDKEFLPMYQLRFLKKITQDSNYNLSEK